MAQPAPANPTRRSRGWTWVLNNYTSEEIISLIDIMEQNDVTGYVVSISRQLHADHTDQNRYVFQEETAPETATPHLQGYLHFKNQRTLSGLRQWNPRIHWESARSISASIRYCSDPAKRTGRLWVKGYNVARTDLGLLDPATM